MAKSGTDKSTSLLAFDRGDELPVDSESNLRYNSSESRETSVSLRSLVDGRLEYTGQVTGKRYVWNQAGSIIEVSSLDATPLLEKRKGKNSCCGNSRDGRALVEQVL